jgi:hypothetical protein
MQNLRASLRGWMVGPKEVRSVRSEVGK